MKKTSRVKNRPTDRERAGFRDPSRAIGRNLEAFLLLELLRVPSYGYDLIRTLAKDGFKRAMEPGVVYKVLRSLEESGAIRSKWSPQESGPARRYYQITDQGRELLRRRAYHLKRQMERTQRLLQNYFTLTGDSLTIDPQDPLDEDSTPEPTAAGRRRGGN